MVKRSEIQKYSAGKCSLQGEAALWYWAVQMHSVPTVRASSEHLYMNPFSLKFVNILVTNISREYIVNLYRAGCCTDQKLIAFTCNEKITP